MPKLPQRKAIRKYKEGFAYIPLGRTDAHGFAKVSLEDAGKLELYFWHKDSNGYAISGTGLERGKPNIYMHQLVLNKKRKGYFADHINRDILDNRRENLRLVSVANSQKNRSAHKIDKQTSLYKGVSKIGKDVLKPWQWAVYTNQVEGGKVYGYCYTEAEAALTYNRYAKQYHKRFAVLNDVKVMPDSIDN